MAQRYCTSCGAKLPEDAHFCGSCGRPAHQTAAVSTPEADVKVPPYKGEGPTSSSAEGGGIRKVVKVDRLDKIVGLLIGAALLLAILWFLVQFFIGFLSGFFGAL